MIVFEGGNMLIEYSDSHSPFSHAGKDLFGGDGLFCVWGGQTRGSFDCQCVDATLVGRLWGAPI
jgi:hypothetical protein